MERLLLLSFVVLISLTLVGCFEQNENIYYFRDGKMRYGKHSELLGDATELRGNVSGIRGDATELRGDVSGILGDVTELRGNVSGILGDVSGIRGDVSGILGDVSGILGDVTELRGDVTEQMITFWNWKHRITVYKSGEIKVGCKIFDTIPSYREVVTYAETEDLSKKEYKALVNIVKAYQVFLKLE